MPVRHVLTILAVSDLERAKRFYDSAFGWTRSVETPVYVEHSLPGGMRLGLYERNGFGKNTGQVPELLPDGALTPTELYLYAEDLPVAIGRVAHAGARPLSALAPRPWGDEVAYFADPEGNVLALARPLKA
jgi:predicted enzyme related to lactoylglutathione lyase